MNEVIIRKPYANEPADLKVFERESLEAAARLACACIERWGMVAAEVDGEDSAGRQKGRLLTSAELVTRAFAVAEEFQRQARERGLITLLPEWKEIQRIGQEQREAERT